MGSPTWEASGRGTEAVTWARGRVVTSRQRPRGVGPLPEGARGPARRARGRQRAAPRQGTWGRTERGGVCAACALGGGCEHLRQLLPRRRLRTNVLLVRLSPQAPGRTGGRATRSSCSRSASRSEGRSCRSSVRPSRPPPGPGGRLRGPAQTRGPNPAKSGKPASVSVHTETRMTLRSQRTCSGRVP